MGKIRALSDTVPLNVPAHGHFAFRLHEQKCPSAITSLLCVPVSNIHKGKMSAEMSLAKMPGVKMIPSPNVYLYFYNFVKICDFASQILGELQGLGGASYSVVRAESCR